MFILFSTFLIIQAKFNECSRRSLKDCLIQNKQEQFIFCKIQEQECVIDFFLQNDHYHKFYEKENYNNKKFIDDEFGKHNFIDHPWNKYWEMPPPTSPPFPSSPPPPPNPPQQFPNSMDESDVSEDENDYDTSDSEDINYYHDDNLTFEDEPTDLEIEIQSQNDPKQELLNLTIIENQSLQLFRDVLILILLF